MNGRQLLFGILFLIAFCQSTVAWSHPFHTSVAECDWNPQSKRWEISLRVHAGDIEIALTQFAGKKLNIESDESQKTICEYLSNRFRISGQSAARSLKPTDFASSTISDKTQSSEVGNRLHWLGQELEGNWAWFYFEMEPSADLESPVLVSQLLTEVNEDQINIISMRQAGARATRQTNRNQIWVELPVPIK